MIRASQSEVFDVLIVGAGQAGASTAMALREKGFDGTIAIFGDEDRLPYERPPLSKGNFAETGLRQNSWVLSEAEARKLSIELRLNAPISRLDPDRQIVWADNQPSRFGTAVLAMGGKARALRGVEGGPPVMTLRTLTDAERLANNWKTAQRIAIIGGGWLGLELAATARVQGLDVMLAEQAERLCSRVLPDPASKRLLDLHESHDVDIALNAMVEFTSTGITVNKKPYRVDCVVACIGMNPRDDLARQAGLAVDNGVLVDTAQQTSAPGIFAVGDCARPMDVTGAPGQRLESWAYASESADRAAAAILGSPLPMPSLPWFWSEQFGRRIQMVGNLSGEDWLTQEIDDGWIALAVEQSGRIVGVITDDLPREFSRLRRAAERGTKLAIPAAALPSTPIVKWFTASGAAGED
jgi:3-phenylpropionate/trans-cinnamate dioxygenase ferredoxin reductase subunit